MYREQDQQTEEHIAQNRDGPALFVFPVLPLKKMEDRGMMVWKYMEKIGADRDGR